MGTSLYSLTQVTVVHSYTSVRRLKICTVKCISNSLIHNLQGKRARFFFVFSI